MPLSLLALGTLGNLQTSSGVGDFPDPSNVLTDDTTNGVAGTFANVGTADVRSGTQWGAAGVEFTGTLILPGSANAGTGSYLGPGGAMRQLFIDDSTGVYSVVGYNMYPVVASQNAPSGGPYGVYRIVDIIHEDHMQNMSGFARARVQWDWYARDPAVVSVIMEYAKLAACRVKNNLVTINTTTIQIRDITLENEYDDFEPITDSKGKPIFAGSQDYYVWFDETVPDR